MFIFLLSRFQCGAAGNIETAEQLFRVKAHTITLNHADFTVSHCGAFLSESRSGSAPQEAIAMATVTTTPDASCMWSSVLIPAVSYC